MNLNICEVKGDVNLKICEVNDGKNWAMAVEKLQLGKNQTQCMQPIEVAERNAGEFFVERIIDHNGLVRNRKDMTFLVRWKGYTEKNDTWESYNNVRLTQAFMDYCTEKKMRSLVSKNLKSSNEL